MPHHHFISYSVVEALDFAKRLHDALDEVLGKARELTRGFRRAASLRHHPAK